MRKFIFVVTAVTMLAGLFGAPAYANVVDEAPGSESSVTAPGAVPNNNIPGPPEYTPPVDLQPKEYPQNVTPPDGVNPNPLPVQDPVIIPDAESGATCITDPDGPNPGMSCEDAGSIYVDGYGYDYGYDNGTISYNDRFNLFEFWIDNPWIFLPMAMVAAAIFVMVAFPREVEKDSKPEEAKKEIRPQDDPNFDPDAPRELESRPDYGTPPVLQ